MLIRRSAERGHFDHGWLDTYHTFSFGEYVDPNWTRFGALRVFNDDRVDAGEGFPPHGHRDMEIVTVVLRGTLEHRDSMGNGTTIRPGEVQLMSAGTGVEHSEFNPSRDEALHLLQMWILPARRGTAPRYEQREFPVDERSGPLRQVVSPDGGDGSLTIGQDARLSLGHVTAGDAIDVAVERGRGSWLHVVRGRVHVGEVELGPGDAVGAVEPGALAIRATDSTDVVYWDVPLDP